MSIPNFPCFRYHAEIIALSAHTGLVCDWWIGFRDIYAGSGPRGPRAVPVDQGGLGGKLYRRLPPAHLRTAAPQGPVSGKVPAADSGGGKLQADHRGPARGDRPTPERDFVGLVRRKQKVKKLQKMIKKIFFWTLQLKDKTWNCTRRSNFTKKYLSLENSSKNK